MPSLSDRVALVDEAAPSHTADEELLLRLRAGDAAAFAAIVDEWSPVMLSVARRYVRDRQAAEDVVQDSWLGVMTGLARFEGRSSVRSWAFSIVINRAKTRGTRDARVLPSARLTGFEPSGPTVDPARFQGAESAHPGHWTSVGAPRPWDEPERQVLAHELGALIDRALDELPERQRLVVQLRDVQGMSAEETCSALSLSPGNQRVLLHRGRAALRAALEDHHDGSARIRPTWQVGDRPSEQAR
jgi:RNA polymerase sigma-70 factor (ECF subfamily)